MSPLAADPPNADSSLDAPDDPQAGYLERCRRVRVGPSVALLFENRRTLAFRIRELEHLARVTGPEAVRRVLDWYAQLLPAPGVLVATLQARAPGSRPSDRLNALAHQVAAGAIAFRIGDRVVPGEVKPTAGGDRVVGPAFWVQFAFPDDVRAALADPQQVASLAVAAEGYEAESGPLPPDVRRSLLEDLGA